LAVGEHRKGIVFLTAWLICSIFGSKVLIRFVAHSAKTSAEASDSRLKTKCSLYLVSLK
jgi:hypothetical protein